MVEGINLFHDQETRTSKGCGLIAMATRAQAVAAMAALDEAHVMEGGAAPLSVKWADTDLRARRNSRSAKEDAPAPAAAAAGDRADDRTVRAGGWCCGPPAVPLCGSPPGKGPLKGSRR